MDEKVLVYIVEVNFLLLLKFLLIVLEVICLFIVFDCLVVVFVVRLIENEKILDLNEVKWVI